MNAGRPNAAEGPGFYLTPAEEERQAQWYAAHRRELYRQVGLARCERVLEVGCGSGVITAELAARARRLAVGVDIRPDAARAAALRRPAAAFVAADAARLPFAAAAFDAVLCAFALVWFADVAAALREVNRALREDGTFVALAEPDYAGAIDYPAAASSQKLMAAAVRRRGGEPAMGRKLAAALSDAGLEVARVGVVNSAWTPARWAREEEQEFELMARLVAPAAPAAGWPALAEARRAAIERGERCYFLPLFYAVARKVR